MNNGHQGIEHKTMFNQKQKDNRNVSKLVSSNLFFDPLFSPQVSRGSEI